jgi:arylsulfatase A-like enzyme
MPARALLRSLTIALLAGAACAKAPQSPHYDLQREAPHAEWVFPSGGSVVLSPTLDVHFNEAARADRALEGRTSPSRLEARVFPRGSIAAGQSVSLALFVEAEARGAALFLGRERAPSDRLEPGWRRYVLPLTPGENGGALELAVEPVSGAPLDPAAMRLLGAGLVPSGEGPLAPPVGDAGPVLTQVGPSAIRFVLPLPEAAELRFTPVVEAPAGPVRMWITLESLGSAPREIWSAAVRPGSAPAEVAVSLATRPGDARVALHLEGRPGVPVVAGWRAPRILGRGGLERLRPRVQPVEERARTEPQRASLAGLNVLIVVLDAGAAGHFGCYGYARPTTLNVDRLAREGVLFERAYTPAPFTIAAVSSMWTSQYPDQHHAGTRHRAPLPRERLTLAEVLKARSVSTVGFAANPNAGPPFGLDRGFEEFHLLPGAGGASSHVPRAEEFRAPVRDWLSRNQDRRFLAYLHLLEPHFPYDPPHPFNHLFGRPSPRMLAAGRDDGWVRKVNAGRYVPTAEEAADLVRLYDGNLAYADREIGWLRQTLEELGLLERTVVIVTADHGESLLERGALGHGTHLYEECVRVPLVMRFPGGRGPAGLRVRELVGLLDIAPTVADMFGALTGTVARTFEGVSLFPVIGGGRGRGVVLSRSMQERPAFALNDGTWKLIHSLKTGRSEVYHLSDDPDEQHDLVEAEPLRAELMRQELYRWLRDLRVERGTATEERLNPAEREALRALGYVDGADR